ncbi:orotidine-5'-phosphate decarboxylase [Mobiluncus mulieris]|uniref:Orotidine 5'-phosphate decarboxylase n=1 Tax=Mobiluncus mulieris TaxID=2052 RepID=A0A8G2HVA5_9ACTO|nr:orotidine-5'-phosphate decarboxylase [Mobiluncus mulieris]MBB5846107.1 orotidine-5'-phosphate decarboxylase [Mobiluncus mulieris]MCU9995325.1 orotidine-5'-phosphate decarboxylase [Mobiluncus mulieris]MCV0001718.1 orotidine-5'-phosphate decarboxylase [Mobiluncus mulieris]MCV0010735.1 orotidine-5'-phosphate decarboxylase [Mobiluncus mulieris]STO17409.1 orotidine 5'-phosphate decarboxylase [Mobiluncus mulieris]
MVTNTQIQTFGTRFQQMRLTRGPLCVGIDPHPELLEAWDLPVTGAGVWDFSMRVIDALGDTCGFFKPQSALYEEYGSSGISALTATLRAIKDVGALSIIDVKRGDIGSTMSAYARAYLGDGPLGADAMTVSPFLGFESLRPAFDMAKNNGRGVFVLTLTSNPESAALQSAIIQDKTVSPEDCTVAAGIMSRVGRENAADGEHAKLGNIGMVIGATVSERLEGLEGLLETSNGPILVPGFGVQGGTSSDISQLFGTSVDRVVVSSSRGILRAGPDQRSLQNSFKNNLEALKLILMKQNSV